MYDNVPSQARPSRFSAYAFNNTAQMGSGAAWQPTTPIAAGQWLHVVAEYQTETTPYYCSTEYPGSISIWINGVKRDEECMSSFSVTPQAGNSPLNIATMALDTWFKGAIGKVAIYNHLLLATQIQNHYIEMTAK
jgi:hypothetical protein